MASSTPSRTRPEPLSAVGRRRFGSSVIYSSPAVGRGIVYIGTVSPDNKLYAFNAVSGAAIAGFPIALTGTLFASPTLFGGNVYAATYNDSKIYAFNATTGTPISGFPVTLGSL